jgi:N6-L-threonylcarbamoyladenine synthase
MKKYFTLGIETSCDDTSIAILKAEQAKVEIISHVKFNQELLLKKFGGVVPELAARNHLEKITPLLDESFKLAQVSPQAIDLIGVTTLPGLLGPLLTGLNAAKSIALLHQKPIVAVNHLFAHLEAIHLTEKITYPYLGLLVSGGHSIYFLVSGADDFKLIGSTIDDAAGEAFDKGGKLMGLGYPAGQLVDQLAKSGDCHRYPFPIGLNNKSETNLSFSGVKTALRNLIQAHPDILKNDLNNLCASYQFSIVNALNKKMHAAINYVSDRFQLKRLPLVVGGGVACNSKLREVLTSQFQSVYFVKPEFCTDNGAMIAHYAYLTRHNAVAFPSCLSLDARGRYVDKTNIQKSSDA